MSFRPLRCSRCQDPCVFERLGLLPDQTEETYYGVLWRCPKCTNTALDVCPVGPLVPRRGTCLNCGGTPDPEGGQPCPACGLSEAEMRDLIGLEVVPADPC